MHGLLDNAFRDRLIHYVAGQRQRFAARRLNALHESVETIGASSCHRDGRTSRRESQRRTFTNAR
ncbi:hypothetical protein GCM10011487_18360 [Steroidobacter agaridevorans]|uniref:Uncharacterized protein n=1 Tax=Steroidobacter agaridevorans TaxID=2695856 RepID=A0A829YAV6_9GAMM|nr:hypothetical protein GCM10011487_18360 [Steroidobacter agaridevorans]